MTAASATAHDRLATAGAAAFQPEVVLPSQLLDPSHLGAASQPEKRLMLAVLEEAVATYQRGATAGGRGAARAFEEARAWFASADVRSPYSFLNVCHVLALDPGYLRRGLEAWRTRARQSAAAGTLVPFRVAFRRISGSRTRAVVPRRLR